MTGTRSRRLLQVVMTHPRLSSAALACVLAAPVFGQADPADARERELERLEEVARERATELDRELRAAKRAWRLERRKAAKAAKATPQNGEPVLELPEDPDLSAFVPKFFAAGEEFAGTDQAFTFLRWVVVQGARYDAPTSARALKILGQHYADDRRLPDLAESVASLASQIGDEPVVEFLSVLEEVEASIKVQAVFAMSCFRDTIERAPIESPEYDRARTHLLGLAEREGASPKLAKRLQQVIDVREKFGVGATAPDIVGVDLDGTEFALSDYQGKVIFLDFWGDW